MGEIVERFFKEVKVINWLDLFFGEILGYIYNILNNLRIIFMGGGGGELFFEDLFLFSFCERLIKIFIIFFLLIKILIIWYEVNGVGNCECEIKMEGRKWFFIVLMFFYLIWKL